MIKEVFVCLRDGFKELFSKDNLKKYMVYGFLALPLVLLFVGFFCVPSKAYSEDSNGNLVSDNLYNIGDYSENNNLGVSFSIHNQTLTLNGSSTAGSWNNIKSLSVLLTPGTYTIQWFTDYQYNNIGFGLYNSANGLSELYQLNSQRYKSFTISQTTVFTTLVWWQASGLSFNNVKVSCMVYSGNYKGYASFEPYGAIYYSQSNYNNAYNQGVTSVFDGLRDFNAIQGYYSSSILFRSTDNGKTFSNLNSLSIAEQNVIGGNLQVSLSAESWAYGDNVIYYIDIDFANPVYFANLYLPSLQRPNPQYVVVNDNNYDFNYTMINGTGYFVTRNIYSISNNLRFYFKAYEGMPLSFDIIIKGFNNAVDSYQTGFNDGVESMEQQVDLMEENIEALERKVKQLNEFIASGSNSWQALFFSMADTPLKTISNMLGFELFGLNVFHALIGIITTLAILFVIKRLIK